MSARSDDPSQRAKPYLSRNQQDLLFAALQSQANGNQTASPSIRGAVVKRSESDLGDSVPTMPESDTNTLFISPKDTELDGYQPDYTPDLDYLDGGDSYDFDNADLGGDMIGALPGSGAAEDRDETMNANADGHEKRKSPDEEADSEGGDSKRQETQEGEKGAKKPGRKPLTNEPTTKRKAQNRAAQRAFRERKEKHLKDLETKVSELTKTQEADKHENGLLKAQVERLTIELREYRKRLSLNSSSVSRSPPLSASAGPNRSNSGPAYSGNFQFDFPKFGALPGSQIFGNQGTSTNSGAVGRDSATTTPSLSQSPVVTNSLGQPSPNHGSRQSSIGRSMSPQSNQASNVGSPAQPGNATSTFSSYSTNSNMHGFASTLPQMTGSGDPFGDLFSPSILKSAGVNGYFENAQNAKPTSKLSNASPTSGGHSTSGLHRVFQFNGDSNASDSTSPSASSSSQWNANGTGDSSCGTSPEPYRENSISKDKSADFTPETSQNSTSPRPWFGTTFGFDNADYSIPAMSNFDPVLFGDYRESNDAIVGGGDFSGGFFDDALNSASLDYGSPSNLFGILQSPQQMHSTLNTTTSGSNVPPSSKNLIAEMEKTRDGGEDDAIGLPTRQESHADPKLISCNNIWNQIQSNTDYKEGKFDLDLLCSELRTKAKCSESGVQVEQNHVDAALRKLGKKNPQGKPFEAPTTLMFEQNSWDAVMHKLKKGSK